MESSVEKYLKIQVERLGGLCIKLTGFNGIMDRLCILPNDCLFVETKDKGKSLRKLQQAVRKKFESLGMKCYMTDTKEKVDTLLDKYKTY
jgi:hypothetical protein